MPKRKEDYMPFKSVSFAGRALAALVLAGAAVPTVQAWRQSHVGASVFQTASDTGYDTDAQWTLPNTLELQLKPGFNSDTLAQLSLKVGASIIFNSDMGAETGVARVTLPDGANVQQALDTLRSDARVEVADVEHLYRDPDVQTEETSAETPVKSDSDGARWKPNDPRYGEQWNFQVVKAEEAWEITKGKGVTVAVIDTGVAYADSRKGKIARDFKETKFAKGHDFVNKDDIPYDDQGHGTHVAGTIAESTDNNEGVAGLAFESTVMPIKVLSAQGGGTSADIGEGIRWAADHGAKVINMSLGGPYPDKLMGSACEYAYKKGVTIVCAAGNSGREGVGYPAGFPECIAVSAIGPTKQLSFYSSWGKQVAIAAPGGDSQVGGPAEGKILQNTVFQGKDDYYGFQGTSMASPHVAAIAALIESKGVKDPQDVRAVLQKSAQKVDGPKEKYGAGIVDAAGAVKLAANTYGDGVARFWFVLALFGGCYVVGKSRAKKGERDPYPIWTTAAFSFGLLFPDWLMGYLGMSSHINIIAHSVLVPAALLVLGAKGKDELRCLGWLSFGLTLHLGWEFLRHTVPMGVDLGLLPSLAWVAGNVVVGAGIWLTGLTAKD